MSSDAAISFAASALGIVVLIVGILVIGWLLYRIIIFVKVMQEVRASASRKNSDRNFLMLNLFDATGLNDKKIAAYGKSR